MARHLPDFWSGFASAHKNDHLAKNERRSARAKLPLAPIPKRLRFDASFYCSALPAMTPCLRLAGGPNGSKHHGQNSRFRGSDHQPFRDHIGFVHEVPGAVINFFSHVGD